MTDVKINVSFFSFFFFSISIYATGVPTDKYRLLIESEAAFTRKILTDHHAEEMRYLLGYIVNHHIN